MGNSRLDAQLESHRASRIAGGVVMAVGLTAGLTAFGLGMKLRNEREDDCETSAALTGDPSLCEVGNQGIAGIAIGALLAGAGALVGALLIPRKDRFHVELNERATWRPEETTEQVASEEPSAATTQASAPGERRAQVEAALKRSAAAVRSCIRDIPVTASLQVASNGSLEALALYGDAEPVAKDCLRKVIATLAVPAGSREAVELDLQPLLR